jgi:hypothetical protein
MARLLRKKAAECAAGLAIAGTVRRVFGPPDRVRPLRAKEASVRNGHLVHGDACVHRCPKCKAVYPCGSIVQMCSEEYWRRCSDCEAKGPVAVVRRRASA